MSTNDELLKLALEALELAEGVMSYCQGDAWERECTEKDRSRFQEIYNQFFPPAPPQEVIGHYGHYSLKKKQPRIACPVCNKKIVGIDGLMDHSRAVHNYAGSQLAFRLEHAASIGVEP
jgi:hypothetical protein